MADNSGNVFEQISSSCYGLTVSEKKIADFITEFPEKEQEMGILDLAEACATAMATVSRFSRKLGYDGFNAMKIAPFPADPGMPSCFQAGSRWKTALRMSAKSCIPPISG